MLPERGPDAAQPEGHGSWDLPQAGRCHVFCLPGVPTRDAGHVAASRCVAPQGARPRRRTAVIHSRTLHFYGIGESLLESKVEDLLKGANPTVAPYASTGEARLRITAKAGSLEEARALIAPGGGQDQGEGGRVSLRVRRGEPRNRGGPPPDGDSQDAGRRRVVHRRPPRAPDHQRAGKLRLLPPGMGRLHQRGEGGGAGRRSRDAPRPRRRERACRRRDGRKAPGSVPERTSRWRSPGSPVREAEPERSPSAPSALPWRTPEGPARCARRFRGSREDDKVAQCQRSAEPRPARPSGGEGNALGRRVALLQRGHPHTVGDDLHGVA